MEYDRLFEQRNLVGIKLKDCMRDKGYTKVSFAKKADISSPTLDKILNGNIDSKMTFDLYLQKILKVLDMSAHDLMCYVPKRDKLTETVHSKNASIDHQLSETAKKQYNLLLDVIDLCAIYY